MKAPYALAGDTGFSVKRQSETKDLEILEQARRKFDDKKCMPQQQQQQRSQQQQQQQQQQREKSKKGGGKAQQNWDWQPQEHYASYAAQKGLGKRGRTDHGADNKRARCVLERACSKSHCARKCVCRQGGDDKPAAPDMKAVASMADELRSFLKGQKGDKGDKK